MKTWEELEGVQYRREDGKGKNHVHLKEKIFKYLFHSLRRREVYLYPFCKIKCHNFKYMFTINVFKTLGDKTTQKARWSKCLPCKHKNLS